MKLKISGLENEIDFDNYINIIEFQEKEFFSKSIFKLNDIINNKEEINEIILLDNNEQIKISKNIKLYIDIFNIDFNSKEILSKVHARIEKLFDLERNIDNDEYFKLSKGLIEYIRNIINEMPFEWDIDEKIGIKEILKVLNLKIDIDKYTTLSQKVMFLIDVISEFSISNIIAFVNLKKFFNSEQLEEIYKYSIAKEIKILSLECGLSDGVLKYEKKLIIDSEYDDFLVK